MHFLLADIGKDHPALLIETCARWSKEATTPERTWIVNHALRSLVKRGDRGALRVVGYSRDASVRVAGARIEPARPSIGDRLRFSADLISTAERRQELLVDFAIHYVKADRTTRPKVFKLDRLELEGGASTRVAASVSLAQMTTRTHHPGRHRIELIVNGTSYALGDFYLASDATSAGVRARR